MSLANVKRGDTVFRVFYGWNKSDGPQTRHVVVTGSGPKYISVGKDKYHREDGAICTNYSPHEYIFASQEEWEAQVLHGRLSAKAREMVANTKFSTMSDDKLRALISLLEDTP